MNEFGIKKISIDNWTQPDSIMSIFVRTDQHGQTRQSTEFDWIQAILKPEMGDAVPADVQSLFEVARGSMTYGYFFYPLFTLAAEQLFRVAETAIALKCNELNAPKSVRTYHMRIAWLLECGAIDRKLERHWESARKLRNSASHPSKQTILTPGDALSILSLTAENITALFNDNE